MPSNCPKFERNWCPGVGGLAHPRFQVNRWGAAKTQITVHSEISNVSNIPVFTMCIYSSCPVTVPSWKLVQQCRRSWEHKIASTDRQMDRNAHSSILPPPTSFAEVE